MFQVGLQIIVDVSVFCRLDLPGGELVCPIRFMGEEICNSTTPKDLDYLVSLCCRTYWLFCLRFFFLTDEKKSVCLDILFFVCLSL